MIGQVLLISATPEIVSTVGDSCRQIDAHLTDVEGWVEAARVLAAGLPDLVVCDYETFEVLREQYPRLSVLLYAEPADSEQAIEAIKQGALDYLVTPVEPNILARHLLEALRISRDIRVPAVYEEPDDSVTVERIIGQSPAMREVYKLIGRIAPREVNVLITGESGTGKELVARAILHHSPRSDRPFLAVNCAAIPEALIESELFGHEKGAFTGAAQRRIGRFEQCHRGTLFLDEIGDIPLATQAKLLRVLQDRSFQRLGGAATITSDVRIIAATHRPLEKLIEEKRFRQDLYFRLKVASIDVPPLREREVDVVLLAHQLVRRYNRTMGANIRTFSPDVLPILLKYPWPGNVRELENAIKAALVIARGTVFRPEFLPEHIRSQSGDAAVDSVIDKPSTDTLPSLEARNIAQKLMAQSALSGKLHETATALIEREMICVCLERTRGQLAPAAKLLGISRTTLRKKINLHRVITKTSTDHLS